MRHEEEVVGLREEGIRTRQYYFNTVCLPCSIEWCNQTPVDLHLGVYTNQNYNGFEFQYIPVLAKDAEGLTCAYCEKKLV